MKVAGFTFVRNAVKNNYPFLESIQSILPLCDSFYIVEGKSEDDTLKKLTTLPSNKVNIQSSEWEEKYYKNASIYARQTNKAFDLIPAEFDWCFYIQADECLHEKYFDNIRKNLLLYQHSPEVDCLIFKYKHFYGSYDFVADSRRWYRHEIRIIKNDKNIRSYGDAQGFRKKGKKLRGKKIDAYIYHYGWVHTLKYNYLSKFETQFKYYSNTKTKITDFHFDNADRIKKFEETPPEVMRKKIAEENKKINFNIDMITNKMKWYKKILQWIEDKFGIRLFEYKNFISI